MTGSRRELDERQASRLDRIPQAPAEPLASELRRLDAVAGLESDLRDQRVEPLGIRCANVEAHPTRVTG